MRKIVLTFLITIFFIPFISFAQGGEKIQSFSSDITINSDATFNVVETIEYDFGSQERHGIYRYLPYKYDTDEGKTRILNITNISVKDDKGSAYNFTKYTSGKNLTIKIGDADKLVTGVKTYVISYRVDGAINYFDSRDELYWNVTGNGWDVPIEKVSATINLPQSIAQDKLEASCYIGSYGANDGCSTKYNGSGVGFNAGNSLSSAEGMTIAIGFPSGIVAKKDYIYEVPFLSTLLGKLWLAANVVVPILAFIFMFFLWMKKGRDPKGRGTIIAQYDAPDGVDPVAVGTLVDQRVDKKDISAGIIELAVKGYLKIKRIESGKVLKKKDYELAKLKDSKGLSDYEQKIFNALFSGGETIKLKDLGVGFAKEIKESQKLVYESLVKQGYFAKNPQTVKTIYLVAGFVLLIAGISAVLFVPGLIAVGVSVLVFGFFMPARTLKGVYAREHILGLKEYLSIAEKDRIKFHNAPEKNPETFEKFLPYAMALGVEKEWAKQFEGIFKENPSWYSDPTMGTFSALAFTDSLSSFSSAAGAVSVPASSGGSGVGGGGFSGGGFGGGGGGSW